MITNTKEAVSTPVMTVENGKDRKNFRLTEINSLGFWVNRKTGEGFRITEEALKSGHLKTVGYVSNNDQFSMVNSDPQTLIATLREETLKLNLPVGF